MKIVVVGSGSWGTALAQICADNSLDVILYGRNCDEVNEINEKGTNSRYFEGVQLNSSLKATDDINVLSDADIIVLSIPSIGITDMCRQMQSYITKKVILVNTAKGFDPLTNERMSVGIREAFEPEKLSSVVSLIGPSHAEEVVLRLLTSVCAVSQNEDDAKTIQKLFSNDYFRVYTGTDEIGSELGAAIKNTIALASGMLSGLGYGDNTRAALITRGLAEMIRFGVSQGGEVNTFYGLTGIGDLIVTCTSVHSRNFEAGYQIGKNDGAAEFLKNNQKTVEGIRTTQVLFDLKKDLDVSMPIVDEIYKVLYEGKKPSESAKDLMLRELKAE